MSSTHRPHLNPSFSTNTADEKNEKGHITIVEHSNTEEKIHPQLYNAHIDVSGINEAKLLRKLDIWLVPWLSFLYLLSFLDRTNIGSAKVSHASYVSRCKSNRFVQQLYGMEKDLHITDKQYNLCLTIFFFSYAIFEVCRTAVIFVTITSLIRLIAGPLERSPQAREAIHMALSFDGLLGGCDGEYLCEVIPPVALTSR